MVAATEPAMMRPLLGVARATGAVLATATG
jgi:hypothetical protein